MGAHHSTCRPETGTFRAIFIAPTKLKVFTFRRSLGVRCGYGISIQFNLNTKM